MDKKHITDAQRELYKETPLEIGDLIKISGSAIGIILSVLNVHELSFFTVYYFDDKKIWTRQQCFSSERISKAK